MRKGHRRTHSQTLCLSKTSASNIQKAMQMQPFNFYDIHQQSNTLQNFNPVQSLVKKSEANITQRILHIENLEQPNMASSQCQFSFGKGINNNKLSNFKLNMGQIPQVPKSNESTSLQGQNKIEIVQKDIFHSNQFDQNHVPVKVYQKNQLLKPIRFIPKHAKTSSAVLDIKKINKSEKVEKVELKFVNRKVHSDNSSHRDNSVQKSKAETRPYHKRPFDFFKQLSFSNQGKSRIPNIQIILNSHLVNKSKRKKHGCA